jgi:competence protein CoiA
MEPIIVILRAAPTDCWSCGCEMAILSSIVLSLGATRVDCSVADFSDWPDLIDELSAMLPAAHGVGTIKPRASATADRTYMSNGCRHCDAIFGQHFEVHTRYNEAEIARFEIAPSARWRSFVQRFPE